MTSQDLLTPLTIGRLLKINWPPVDIDEERGRGAFKRDTLPNHPERYHVGWATDITPFGRHVSFITISSASFMKASCEVAPFDLDSPLVDKLRYVIVEPRTLTEQDVVRFMYSCGGTSLNIDCDAPCQELKDFLNKLQGPAVPVPESPTSFTDRVISKSQELFSKESA